MVRSEGKQATYPLATYSVKSKILERYALSCVYVIYRPYLNFDTLLHTRTGLHPMNETSVRRSAS